MTQWMVQYLSPALLFLEALLHSAQPLSTAPPLTQVGTQKTEVSMSMLLIRLPPRFLCREILQLRQQAPSGATVSFTASASDMVDGSVSVTCVPASGTTFPIGTTAVNCLASDTGGNTANGSFNVTVQDTTAPVISAHEDITTVADNKNGARVVYTSPATSDTVDGVGVTTCVPASGTIFSIGSTTVTCTATDSHGNAAIPVTFMITVDGLPATTYLGGFIIPVTGGELFDLDCLTVVNAFGIRVTFHNLCDHQSIIDDVDLNSLPAELPDGLSYIDALNIAVLFEGDLVKELPLGTGVQLDFPITANAQDEYAVLLWDNENNEWLDVTQIMKDEDLSKTLSTDTADELYQIVPTETTKALYRILSTENTGTFVIVKK